MAEPAITFGAAASFGTVAGWAEQSSAPSLVKDRASALGATGNEAASVLHNERTEVSTPYKATLAASSPTIPAVIGAVVNSILLTGISVSTTSGDFASMTLTGHQHTTNPHTAEPTCTHGYAVTVGFGAQDFLGGTASANSDVDSSTLNITCQHIDVLGAAGDHLCGQNFNAMVEAETVWNGVPTTGAKAGWDKGSTETRTTNTGFLQTIVRGTKALVLA